MYVGECVCLWSGYVLCDSHPTESRWQKATVKGKDSGVKLCLLGLNPSFTMCVSVTLGKAGNKLSNPQFHIL